ncbi:DUF4136 domain-containing protein [Pontibacter pamirensis]|uniref:DUF4136 domain-containing protein n=1 Tax=Pontibacter pamirensis TaxID=2562824 RepID=UPI00138953B2|nr:DUF4136 domain-containing protein [Pontibacter pamirensis]
MTTATNRLIVLLCLMMCFIGLNSCVTTSGAVGASAIKAPYARMATYKTYAWFQQQPVAEPNYEKGYNANLDRHIRRAVEEELQERGYRKVESNPDVLVAYDVSVSVPEEKDKPENFSTGFGYSYGYMSGYRYNYGHADMPGYRSVDLFKQGTLIIDLISPQSKMLLWRGWAEGGIPNFKAGYKQVQNQVEKVFVELES